MTIGSLSARADSGASIPQKLLSILLACVLAVSLVPSPAWAEAIGEATPAKQEDAAQLEAEQEAEQTPEVSEGSGAVGSDASGTLDAGETGNDEPLGETETPDALESETKVVDDLVGSKGVEKDALSELRNPADTGVLPLDDSLQTLSDAGLTSECFATVTKLENPTKPTPISVKPLTPENTPVLYATAWNLAKERISEGAWTYQWYAGDAKDAAMDAFKAIPAEDGGTSPSLAISNDFAQKYDGKCLRVSISDADGTTVYGPKKATKYTTLTATNAIEAPQASEAVDLDYAHVVNDESKFSDSGWQGWPESVSSARVGDTLYAAGEAFDEDAYVSTFYFAKDGVGFTWQVEEDGSWVEVATGGSFTVPESCAGKNVRAVADGGGRKAEGESISVASLEPESVDLGYAYVVADEGKFEDFSWWPASDKSASAGDTLHAAACKPDDKYFSNPLFSKDGVTFSWQVEQEDGTWKGVQEGGDSFDVPESCAGTRIRVVADAGKQQATSSEVEIRAAGAVDVYLVELSESGAVAEGTVLKATAYKGDYSSKSPITQGVTYTWEWCEGDPDNSVANPEWHVVEGVTGDTLTLGSDFVDPNAGEGWKGRWIRVTADAGGAGKTVGDVSAVGPVIGSGTYWIHSASAVNVTAGDAAPFRAGDTVNVTAKKFAANGYNADGAIDPDDFSITWYISEESDLGGSYVELDDENAHAKSFTIPESYEGKYLRYRICAGANAYETSMSIDPVAPADAVRVAKVELSCSGFSDLIVPGDTLTARALDDRGNDVTDQVSWSWGYASTATSTYPTPISGETSSAYTLPDKSVYKGKYIYAIATDGTNARVRAVTPSQVKTTGDVKLRSVSIKEDVAQVGKQLTAQAMKLTNALIEPVDAAFDKVSYQWGYVDARDANPSVDPTLFHAIDGATESTFTPTDRVEGKYIVVRATNNTKPTTTVYSTYRPYEGINQQVDALGPVLSSSACALSSVSVASSGQGAQADCFVVPQARTVVGGIESDVSDKVVVEYRWFVSDTADDEGTAVDGGYDPATGKLALRDFEGMYLHATATASANTVAGKPFLVLPADTYDLMRATVDAAAPAVGDTVSVSVQARNLSGSVYGDDVTSGVSLQWYVADEPDGEFAKIEHATGSSLVVPDTAAGSYLKVVATSGASVVESSVVLVKSEADSEVVQATGAVVGVDKNGNDQTWAEAISYDMKKGDTAADLSERLFEEAGIEASYDPNGSWGWYLDSITSPFDKSQTLGYDADTGRYWQLFVNGKSASDGAGLVFLQPGDEVVWYYSTWGSDLPDPDDLVIDPDAERPDYDSSWPGFASGSNGSTVTNVPTPTGAADLAWSFDYKNGAAFAGVSDPLIVNGDVYLISGGTLMKIDAQEGKLLASAGIGGSIRYFCRPAYADGLIIVPTDDGSLAAFTADALTCVWKTDALDTKDGTLSYQALSTLTVNGGYVYAGFTQAGAANDPGTAGALRCVRISDGSIMWTHAAESSDTGKAEGYYWAGAAAAGSDIVIGDESGTVSLVEGGGDAFKVKSSVSLGKPCRSTVVAMDGGTSFLVVTSDGVLHKLTRDGDKLSAAGSVSFSSASTSTPAVSGGKAFVCGSSGEYGALFVIDLASMKVERTVLGGKGYAQSAPLVSVQGDGTYVYFTCNAMPGGVYSYKLGESSAVQLYTPDGALQNYCTASIVADEDGNLYYTNDSGTLFALKGQAGYRVTFDSMGGSYVPRGMTVQGKPLVRPDDPIRAGYVFGGWFVDEGCTRAWDFSNPVTSEMTLYAKWTKKDDGQGGGVPGGSGSSGSGDLLQPAAPFAKSLPTGGAPAATHAPLSQEAAKEETKDTKADRTDKADGATRSEARTSSGMGVDADNGSSDGTSAGVNPLAMGGVALGVVGLVGATFYVVRTRRRNGGV